MTTKDTRASEAAEKYVTDQYSLCTDRAVLKYAGENYLAGWQARDEAGPDTGEQGSGNVDEQGEIPSWDVYRNTRQWLKEHIVEYNNKFDPRPTVNHLSQWPVWAEKFLDSEDVEKKILATMLMYSVKNKDDCLAKFRRSSAKYTALFFAFIETVDRLPIWARWAVRTPKIGDSATSVGNAFKSIQQINEWRRTNKYNIKEWDQ